jgi:lysophospholipase L1-like esterase
MPKPLRTAIEWAVVLVLCLAAVEGALRLQQWWGPIYDLALRGETLAWYSDVVNHKPTPRQSERFVGESIYGRHAGFSYALEYDDNGIRQPVSVAVRAGCRATASILFLGDSFMQGYDVANSIPQRVADALSQKHDICATAYNAGYTSYSPAIFIPLARRLMPIVKPDDVVVDIDETDLTDDATRYEPLIVRNAQGENVGVRASPTYYEISRRLTEAEVSSFYVRRLFEKQYVRQVLMPQIAARQPDIFGFARDRSGDAESRYGAELSIFRRNIAELIEVLEKGLSSPARVVFVHHPHLEQLTADAGGTIWNNLLASTVEKVATAHGAVFFNATPVLHRQFGTGPESFYWKGDMHFTFEGLALYADSVADFLGAHVVAR